MSKKTALSKSVFTKSYAQAVAKPSTSKAPINKMTEALKKAAQKMQEEEQIDEDDDDEEGSEDEADSSKWKDKSRYLGKGGDNEALRKKLYSMKETDIIFLWHTFRKFQMSNGRSFFTNNDAEAWMSEVSKAHEREYKHLCDLLGKTKPSNWVVFLAAAKERFAPLNEWGVEYVLKAYTGDEDFEPQDFIFAKSKALFSRSLFENALDDEGEEMVSGFLIKLHLLYCKEAVEELKIPFEPQWIYNWFGDDVGAAAYKEFADHDGWKKKAEVNKMRFVNFTSRHEPNTDGIKKWKALVDTYGADDTTIEKKKKAAKKGKKVAKSKQLDISSLHAGTYEQGVKALKGMEGVDGAVIADALARWKEEAKDAPKE